MFSDLAHKYELVRSSSVLRKQAALLKVLSLPRPPSGQLNDLEHLLNVTDFFTEKIEKGGGVDTSQNVMKVIADEIEANGMHAGTEVRVSSVMQV